MPNTSFRPDLIIFSLVLALSACSTKREPLRDIECSVDPAAKLTSDSGNAAEVCAIILERIGVLPPGASIRVRAPSSSTIVGQVRLGSGQAMPEVEVGVSDRQLNKKSVEMLARAMADQFKSFTSR